MTGLYARDCQTLANISRELGRLDFATELEARAASLTDDLNRMGWHDGYGIYVNKQWKTNQWYPTDPKTGVLVVGPPNFYPMLASAPSEAQVQRMLQRFLSNATEFAVNPTQAHGMPSISRSSSSFSDNSYWRGRAWGPMNMLVWLGLRQYPEVPAARAAMTALAEQSEKTFLVEWVRVRRQCACVCVSLCLCACTVSTLHVPSYYMAYRSW